VEERVAVADVGHWKIMQVSGKTALSTVVGCGGADVLISNQADEAPRPCLVYDIVALRQSGALKMDVNNAGDLIITSAHGAAGNRPWNRRQGAAFPPVILTRSHEKGAAGAALNANVSERQ
jgi:competence protein ComEC